MTFEEFLTKKKIDLTQFKRAESGLFSEFQSHYSQMGEKSFDHSKKFLFNRLRRAYHLKEEPKPVAAAEVIEINELASQAEPLISPTVEATVYTPRFKPRAASAASPSSPTATKDTAAPTPSESVPSDSSELESQAGSINQAKPAFKPRFRAGITNDTGLSGEDSGKPESPAENKQKPAYVPRFKAPTAAPVDKQKKEPDENPDVPEEKPAPSYKPRFRANIAQSKQSENDGRSSVPESDL